MKNNIRAWDTTRKEFVASGDIIAIAGTIAAYVSYDKVDRLELQLSTTVKDCKGQEVYEGDILCLPDPDGLVEYNQFWPVVFEDGVFVVDNSAIWDYVKCDKDGKSMGCLEELEVVGNIYENKDLLK